MTRAETEPRIGAGDETLTGRDAELLHAVEREGSLNAAAESLGRSYSHAQRRIVELEEAFGELVERRRGGASGGGSRLTDEARGLLRRMRQLDVELSAAAGVHLNVLTGPVTEREGELATVQTELGPVRGVLLDPEAEEAEVAIRADAVTLHLPDDAPEPEETSALNRVEAEIGGFEEGETVSTVILDTSGPELRVLVTETSRQRMELKEGLEVIASFKATSVREIPF